jgi:hypothetical protein
MAYTKPFVGQASFGSYATQVVGHLILALCLIKCAPKIAAFVYTEPWPLEDHSAAKPSDS